MNSNDLSDSSTFFPHFPEVFIRSYHKSLVRYFLCFSRVFPCFSQAFAPISTGPTQVVAGCVRRVGRYRRGSRGARLSAEHRGVAAAAAGAAAAGSGGCGVGRCETLEGDQVRGSWGSLIIYCIGFEDGSSTGSSPAWCQMWWESKEKESNRYLPKIAMLFGVAPSAKNSDFTARLRHLPSLFILFFLHHLLSQRCIWYDMIWHDMIWYDMIWYIICIYVYCVTYNDNNDNNNNHGDHRRDGWHMMTWFWQVPLFHDIFHGDYDQLCLTGGIDEIW